MVTAADRAREARQEQALQAVRAAERAEQLRAELTQARIELEFFERRPAQGTKRSASPAAQDSDRRNVRRGRTSTRGVVVGLWFIVFYLLLVALANGTPDGAASADSSQSTSSAVAALPTGSSVPPLAGAPGASAFAVAGPSIVLALPTVPRTARPPAAPVR
ncbi:hypothetical protein [Arthrobacter agilis]|uniref:hypothetical protein n=1 Tax=Arthrobacter agilis TaxID=37921 RepID=UPI002783F12F|nr:hypothetical protein [Arthrobacter agilis]MDQ0733707.1 hypothetical protein [Arthrobacter agilis]